jgi:hypothetical protein
MYLWQNFGVAFSLDGNAMKRESGVNPEQTRCCKLPKIFEQDSATVGTPDGKEVQKME